MKICLGATYGFSTNEITWNNLFDEYKKDRRHRLVLLLGETVKQWKKPSTDLNQQGSTREPISNRQWVKIELKVLLNNHEQNQSYGEKKTFNASGG